MTGPPGETVIGSDSAHPPATQRGGWAVDAAGGERGASLLPAPRVHHRALARLHGCTASEDAFAGAQHAHEPLMQPEFVFCALATPNGVRHVLERACKRLAQTGLPPEDCGKFELLVAEAMNNIAEHAYRDAVRPGWITLEIRLHGATLVGRLTDGGCPMPDLSLPTGKETFPGGDTSPVSIEDLPEGGFGLSLIRSLARELRYARRGAYNALSFAIDREQTDIDMAIGA